MLDTPMKITSFRALGDTEPTPATPTIIVPALDADPLAAPVEQSAPKRRRATIGKQS